MGHVSFKTLAQPAHEHILKSRQSCFVPKQLNTSTQPNQKNSLKPHKTCVLKHLCLFHPLLQEGSCDCTYGPVTHGHVHLASPLSWLPALLHTHVTLDSDPPGYRPSFTSANPFCFFSTLFLFLFCIVLQYGRTGLLCLLCTFLRLWFRIFFSLDLKLIYLLSSIFSFVLGVLPTHRSSCVLSSRCDLRFGWCPARLRVSYVCGTASLLHQAKNYWVESECRQFHLFHPFISNYYGSKLL